MKPILIHTHFHKRRTGVTRSIENVLPFLSKKIETYIYGYNVDGLKISKGDLKKLLFSKTKVIVHCHRNNELLRMLFYRFLGAKFTLIATRHSDTEPSWLTMFLLKKADKVITLIDQMGKNLGIKNTVIGHGVNVQQFIPKNEVVLKEVAQKKIILCAGRVRKSKGHLTLLNAAKVLQKHKDWALVVVGTVDKPAFLDELKIISQTLEIDKQVYFIQETTNIVSYYQAANIVAVPSFTEGFSLVTLEAMSVGCSVIATKNVGVHSTLIKHAKNGYLFAAGNVGELENLFLKMIEDKSLNTGANARETILEHWSAQKEAENLLKLYLSA